MWKSMKKGFGFASGVILGHATMNVIAKNILKWVAKDEKYMEGLKNRDPEEYEKLKKYQKPKTEKNRRVKTEEAQ